MSRSPGRLGEAFDKLEEASADVHGRDGVLTWRSALLDAEALHATLRPIAGFGVATPFPRRPI